MLQERDLRSRHVVEGHRFVENREVSRFFDISHSTEDEPARVIIESPTDVVVAALGERLVLVIASAVGELR